MHVVGEQEGAAVEDALARFIAQLTWCKFAPHYVGGLHAEAHPPATVVFAGKPGPGDASSLTDLLVLAGEEASLAILAFPDLRTSADVAGLLLALAADPRWRLTLPHPGPHPHDDTVIGLWWITSGSQLSSVMGLAPLGEMPVTRRAPHVALVVWPGAHLNEHPKPKRSETEVGLTSCPLPKHLLERDAYKLAWDRTRSDVAAALAYPKEATARPHIAFSLHEDMRRILAPLSVPCGVDGRPLGKVTEPTR